ncbi:protein-glutamate O-methyltransferase CheR [Petroclostridium sp. X23]|uniref:CheR family methyltransferase n=1 Tax=Petroclostridium sp. X23 TaxID=3045146 RepID=UPI0024ADB3EB|nr:protein-glutamate O-methyltransferase CheR [Petroclostridium sp. X23]WHH59466.1 protein-glutamate O-methyltransferase CheR [Petroclostridium sp. X23]
MLVKDYEDFKIEIFKMTGINLTCYKEKQMKRRIESLMKKNAIENFSNYVTQLKSNKVLYNEFINYLTINVSEFYRNPGQWEILEKEILPMLLAKSRTLKIWSAACSTGEEPYSLAMVLTKFFPLASIKITATDIDKEALAKASIGLYNAKSLEGVPKENINKFFTKEGDFYKIKDEVKKCVEFSQHNLLKDAYPSNCDLIVCRNVLIYFTEEAKTEIYTKFTQSLKPEGILFVGSTEQIIMPNRYNLAPSKTFFYQKLKI